MTAFGFITLIVALFIATQSRASAMGPALFVAGIGLGIIIGSW